ncbi:MAG TPA: amidohydrolase family protein [Vicinamibacteria bacterium]|nr:amidohydrolase family protein [Vicinamibacteria bacterium]
MEILTASWVLPISRPPVSRGRVAIDGSRVVWVGRAGEAGEPDAPVRDLGEGVLVPGLVNAHCHLELSHLAGRLELGHGFVPWVEDVVASRGRFTDDEIRVAAAGAVRFLEEHGTVAVADVSNALGHLDLLGGARLSAVVFLELLAWDPAKAEATLAWADERLRSIGPSLRPGVEVRLAAHAPHSVSPALLRGLVERGGAAAIHLAESRDEAEFLASGGGAWPSFLAKRGLGHVELAVPGLSPVRYTESLGVLHSRLVAAHGVQVDAADREVLARHGVSVVLCPRSNRNLGVGTADAPALRAAGVRLALGTDSLASVETLDVLEDAALLQRQFPDLDPAAIVRMATLGGAEALGLDDLGAIAPGRRAALAFAEGRTREPHAWLLSGEARLRPLEAR